MHANVKDYLLQLEAITKKPPKQKKTSKSDT